MSRAPLGAQFRLLLAARACGWIAGAVTAVVLPIALYLRTGDAALTALLAGLEVTPYLLVGLFAGVVADRARVRSVAVTVCVVCAVCSGSIPLAQALGVLTVLHLFVSAFVAGVALVFFDASMFAALPAVVGRDRIARAYASMTAFSTIISLSVPAVAGLLTGVIGPETTLVIDTGMYLVAGLTFLLLREPSRSPLGERAPLRRSLTDGLRFIAGNRIVRSLTALGLGNSLAEGLLSGLLIAAVVRVHGMPEDGPFLGFAFAAMSVGGLIGAQLLPRLSERLAIGTITVSGLVVAALGMALWSRLDVFWLGIAGLVVYQTGSTLVILNGIAARARVTPDRMQGRVNTTARMLAWGGQPLGALIGAVTVVSLGVVDTHLIGVAVLLVTALIAGVTLRGIGETEVQEGEAAATQP